MPYASKLLNSLLAAALALSLAACGSTGDTSTPNTSSPGGRGIQRTAGSTQLCLCSGRHPDHPVRSGGGFAEDGALHWYGVPYAQAPVGELR